MQVLLCPDDPVVQANPTIKAQMSYVVNNQYFLNYLVKPPTNIVTGNPQTATIISKLPVPLETVMLLENTPKGGSARRWDTDQLTPPWRTPATDAPILTYSPPLPSPPNPPTAISNVVSSQHGGIIVVSFFDGHQDKLKADANYPPH